MSRSYERLALAIAASLGLSTTADATPYTATLESHVSYSTNGSALANLAASTATWDYDTATGILAQSSGTFNTRFTTSPTNTLFRHVITGLIVGDGGAAQATSFECQEGNFGGFVGASICGNYRFGGNSTDESTVSWGPGTTFDRTLDGDDMAIGPQQNLTAYDGFNEQSLDGDTVVLSNAVCISTQFFDCSADPSFLNTGYDLTFTLSGGGPDTASTDLNTPTAPIDVLANDRGIADTVTVSVVTPPDGGGSVSITSDDAACADPCFADRATIRMILTPAAAADTPTYTETFTYQADDGVNPPISATVTVTVNNVLPEPEPDPTGRSASGGSATDLAVMSLLLGSRLLRRRRR